MYMRIHIDAHTYRSILYGSSSTLKLHSVEAPSEHAFNNLQVPEAYSGGSKSPVIEHTSWDET